MNLLDRLKTHAVRLSGLTSIYRHTLPVRIAHWINVVCVAVMLMSGLQIFNAHSALYWGKSSDFEHPLLSMTAQPKTDGTLIGITRIGGWPFDTTGVLGASRENGVMVERGFPSWATLPTQRWLAKGRLIHFLVAWFFVVNGLGFCLYAVFSRHLVRDLLPTPKDLGAIPHEIVSHARLQFPKGEASKHYNALQKIAYFAVIFIVGPLIVLTGLTMSPTMDAAFHPLLWVFDGRQSARTIHFLCASALLLFFAVHIIMVLLSGPLNNLRAIITGRYAIQPEKTDDRP